MICRVTRGSRIRSQRQTLRTLGKDPIGGALCEARHPGTKRGGLLGRELKAPLRPAVEPAAPIVKRREALHAAYVAQGSNPLQHAYE